MISHKKVTTNGDKLLRVRKALATDFTRHWQLYIMLFLPIAYIIIFMYIPMGGLVIAFKDYQVRLGIFGSPWVGLRHFRNFVTTPHFELLLKNTIYLSFYSLAAGFPLPILLALFINEVSGKKFKKSVQMITYAPYFISVVVLVGILSNIFSMHTGLVNNVLALFGFERVNYIGVPGLFRSLYVWSGVWQTMGYSAVIYIAALAGVDQELVEASIIDGANRVRRVIHIDLPSIAPTITILLILAIGNIMSVGFEKVYLMQNPVNMRYSEIISTFVYKRGLQNFQYSFSSAVGFFNSVVNFILLAMANFAAKKMGNTSLW